MSTEIYTHTDGTKHQRAKHGYGKRDQAKYGAKFRYYTDSEMAALLDATPAPVRPSLPIIEHGGRKFEINEGAIARALARKGQVDAGVPANTIRITDMDGRVYTFASSADFSAWFAKGLAAIEVYLDDLEDYESSL